MFFHLDLPYGRSFCVYGVSQNVKIKNFVINPCFKLNYKLETFVKIM